MGSVIVYTPNYEFADAVSGPFVVDLPAGAYSFKVRISNSAFGTATVYASKDETILTWKILPN